MLALGTPNGQRILIADQAAARASRAAAHTVAAAPPAPAPPASPHTPPPPPRTPRARPAAPPPQRLPAAGSTAVVIAFALAQVGHAYVMGAAGPGAYDCSGLAMAAYARVGIHLPHSASAMTSYGRPVTLAALQPGDLVFWPGHVAIYIGGGRVVAAANSREGVVIQPIWGTPIAYRRLL